MITEEEEEDVMCDCRLDSVHERGMFLIQTLDIESLFSGFACFIVIICQGSNAAVPGSVCVINNNFVWFLLYLLSNDSFVSINSTSMIVLSNSYM